jgi:hypothetical protein
MIAWDQFQQSSNFNSSIGAPRGEKTLNFDLNPRKELQKHDKLVEVYRTIILPVFFCMGVKLGLSRWEKNVG